MTVTTVKIFGTHDQKTLDQLARCADDTRVEAAALMADGHLGYSMPIGGVIAYRDAVSPSGVGFDIGCGNMAVRTDMLAGSVDVSRTVAEIQSRVSFGLGRKNQEPVEDALFDDDRWGEVERLSPGLTAKARAQLGTVGSGNHYVDLLADEDGVLWVANHFGSRGFGHTIASGFLSVAAGKAFGERVPESDDPSVLDVGTAAGDSYLALMELAGLYAYAGREHVIAMVLRILGWPEVTMAVHNHHNYAWLEDGLYVVRKGATPLTTAPAFIGASMGEPSVIVRGKAVGEPLNDLARVAYPVEDIGAVGSAPHGAGRAMSRTRAAGKWKKVAETRTNPAGEEYTFKRRVRDEATAEINWRETHAELAARGIRVLGAGADEAPAAYKRLDEVLAAHSNVEVLHRLSPLGVVMAGDDTFDPYKD